MRFDTLNLEGFLSIGKATINLANRGLVLIEGKNLDDPSAKSNGAGKSSLVDGLCWCLYGKTARGLSGEEVINQKSKACVVSVEISEGTHKYVITRKRKGKTADLTITHEYDYLDEEFRPVMRKSDSLSKGTIAETQAEIEKIIGCPFNVFVAAVYAGQEAMPDLPSMTDKQLKELIESVIGVERLTKAYALAKEEYNSAHLEVERAKTRIETLEAIVADKISKVSDADESDRLAKQTFEKNAAIVKIKIEEKEKALEEAISKGPKFEETAAFVAKKIEGLTEAINQVEEYQNKAKDAMNAASKASYKMSNATFEFDKLRAEARRLGDEYKNVALREGKACPECGKIYTAKDIAPAKELAQKKAKAAVDKAIAAKNALAPLVEAAKKAQEAYEEAKKAIPDNTAFAEKSRLTEQLRQIKDEQAKPERIKSEICQLKRDLKFLEDAYSSRRNVADVLKEQIAETNENIEKTKLDYNAAEAKLAVLEACKEIYGPTGVRQHVLDTITPVLNDRTARYLDVLSDGKLQAIWTTLTRTKKGEVKEKFNIAVTNTVGGGSFESLSGGEKRKVRVACCLALQELVASRATKPIELFIADEVDHALDEAGVERLIGVLQEKAECCKSLFVISHNPLRNWIENVITVTKHDGISAVE